VRALYVVNEALRTGAPQSALRILDAMRALGWHPAVLLLRGGPLEHEFAARAERLLVEPAGVLGSVVIRARWHGFGFAPAVDRAIAATYLRRLRPEVVIGDTVLATPYVRVALGQGVPTGLIVRDRPSVAKRFLAIHDADGRLKEAVLGANSLATIRLIRRLVGVSEDRVHLLPPTIDVPRWRAAAEASRTDREPGDRRRVVAVGSVGPLKGADLFVDVAEAVVSLASDVEFVWLGEGRRRDALRREIQARGLGDHVRFPGSVADVAWWLGRSDVVVIPSREEPLSRVALEAMAAGVPVVAFDVGGIAEALGSVGQLVDPFEIAHMAAAVGNALELDAEAMAAYRNAALRRAQAFDVTALGPRVEGFLRDLSSRP
jgi:glycosyltransferase involved in cell wall biosynthesis